jgi:PAS domain S-box-containing protein
MGEEIAINSRKGIAALAGVAVLVGLYFASLYNYLLFHALAEGFGIVVACGIFIVAWNSRRFLDNNYFLLLGMAFLFIGGVDLLHTLAYKGMNIFPGYDADLPTQLWVSARYLESISLLIAPLLIGRAIWEKEFLALYATVFVLLMALVFSGHFPSAFVEGQGLTPFKKISEYVISLILVGSLFTLRSRREAFDPKVLELLYWAILLTIGSELAFTFYVSVYGISNLVGHFLKLVAFVLIYRALVVTGLKEPYSLMFRNLKASETKYRSLIDNMINGVAYHKVVTDENGKPVDFVFLEVNDSFKKLTGLRRADIIGRKVTEVLPGVERDPADWIGVYGRVALTGAEVSFEQHSEALGRWYSVSAYSPEHGYFVAVFEDITKRKEAEEALNHYRERLEETIRERTAELVVANEDIEHQIAGREMAESQLLQAQKMDAVGQLAGGVAHDFNNRLFAIRNYAYILKSMLGGGDGADTVDKLIASCDKAAGLVDDLLRFSRKKAINPKPVDANAIVREARNILEMSAGKNTELLIELSDEPLQVMADAPNMEHVLLNLVNNARDAMGGGGTITISTGTVGAEAAPYAELDGGQSCPCAVISVSDTGPGLGDDMKNRIFDPFFTTKSVGKGTGLGLSIVYGTVKQHGGFIDVESAPGKGTTFRIYLPLLK